MKNEETNVNETTYETSDNDAYHENEENEENDIKQSMKIMKMMTRR